MARLAVIYPFRSSRPSEPRGGSAMSVSRRTFLTSTAALAVALGAAPSVVLGAGDERRRAPLALGPPDANGIALPPGFTSRVVARQGHPVGASGYLWHRFPDGGACFSTPDGGWIYVSNSESFGVDDGGAGAIRFDRGGHVLDAYPVLTGTSRNCAGGPTPWGTWLSCEEIERGRVFECDPTGATPGRELLALGRFSHEAAAVGPDRRHVYLTEDQPDGRLYRFTATVPGDLRHGMLSAARVDGDGSVHWLPIPDPSGATIPTRLQVPETTPFAGGEGIWWINDTVTFVTKRDHRVWRLDPNRGQLELVYDALADSASGVLGEPDNIVVTRRGDIYVCEDQPTEQQIVLIDRHGSVAPVLQLVGQNGSELTGIAFNPRGDRMYISSQRGTDRGPGLGITYEISGPFNARTGRYPVHA